MVCPTDPCTRGRATRKTTRGGLYTPRDAALYNGIEAATPPREPTVLYVAGADGAPVGCCAQRKEQSFAFSAKAPPTFHGEGCGTATCTWRVACLLLVCCFPGSCTRLRCCMGCIPRCSCIADCDVDQHIDDVRRAEAPNVEKGRFALDVVIGFLLCRLGTGEELGDESLATGNCTRLADKLSYKIGDGVVE